MSYDSGQLSGCSQRCDAQSVFVNCIFYKQQVLTDVSGVTSAAHTPDSDTQGSKKGCLFAILGPSGVNNHVFDAGIFRLV